MGVLGPCHCRVQCLTPPLVTAGSPAPTPYGPREDKAGSLERHWSGDRCWHATRPPRTRSQGSLCPSAGRAARGTGGGFWTRAAQAASVLTHLSVRPLLIWSPSDACRRMWGAGPGAGGLPARPFSGTPVAQRSGRGYLERSWLEPRLSTGEMLAECRRAACLLGEAGWEPALDLVRDRERLFFFFSWGLLEGKRF